VHLGRQDSDKKAFRIGNMDAGMRGNVKTFRNEDGEAGREEWRQAGSTEADRGGWRHARKMEVGRKDEGSWV
jgi:hypothetical protein